MDVDEAHTTFNYPEVTREGLKLRPRDGNTFNIRMILMFKRQHCFEEDDPLIIFGKHAHEALHEILRHH